MESSSGPRWSAPTQCASQSPLFTKSPIDPENLWYIEPMGKLHGGHVTPTDHTYFNHSLRPEYERHFDAVRAGQAPDEWVSPFDVMTPGDGIIVEIQAFPFGPAPYGFTGTLQDYRVVIWHSCSVASIYIHLGGLAPEILDVTGEIPSGSSWSSPRGDAGIQVAAGQVIGKVGAQGFDYSVHDTSTVLDGFVIPAHYDTEPWKIYTADIFDYFAEPLRSELLDKSPRTVAPFGGRIDYDIDGRLVGNWFLEGTVDYSGGGTHQMCGNRPCPYWDGHLSIAYDHIDPTQLRISIGADIGIGEEQCRICQGAYGVQGNGPDPAIVTPESGLIKYNLVSREHIGHLRIETLTIENNVLGVFLAQMLDAQTIKMEVIPGQRAADVSGFSEAASIYRR